MAEGRSLRDAARERLRSPARFLVLSGLSFALNLVVTAALHEGAGLGTDASFALALAMVFLANFALMRWYVFPGGSRPLVPQLVGFGLSSLAFRGLEFAGFLLLHRVLGLAYLLAAATTLSLSFATKYVYYNAWLFAREPGGSER